MLYTCPDSIEMECRLEHGVVVGEQKDDSLHRRLQVTG